MLEVLSPREENGSDEDSVPMLWREDALLACATSLDIVLPNKTIAEAFKAEWKKLAIILSSLRSLLLLIVTFLENGGYSS